MDDNYYFEQEVTCTCFEPTNATGSLKSTHGLFLESDTSKVSLKGVFSGVYVDGEGDVIFTNRG